MTDSAVKVPLSERINFRLLLLLAVVLTIIGYPVYLFVDSKFSGGIKQEGNLLHVDLKAMSEFEMPQLAAVDEDLPDKWRELNGKPVKLVGQMLMSQAVGGDSDFDLCYSIAKCCFSGVPKIQHFVKCRMPEGVQTPYFSDYVEVTGTLHVGVERDGQQVLSVFRCDVESIRPYKG